MSVSSTGSSSDSNFSRISGLATGIDTESWVQDLMQAEKVPLNKLYQKRQVTVWKQEAYRDIISDIRAIKDDYFNVLKPSANMTSSGIYKQFSFASSDSDAVTAIADDVTAITTGETTIKISQLATAGTATSIALGTSLQGSTLFGDADAAALSGKDFNVTLDGVTKQITIGTVTDQATFLSDVQASLDDAFGTGKVTIDVTNPGDGDTTNDYLTFSLATGSTKITLTSGTDDDALAGMYFDDGDSNRVGTGSTLQEIADDNPASGLTFFDLDGDSVDEVRFKINSETFTFEATDTIATVISTINANSDAGVRASYDELTDTFNLTATQLGEGENIQIEDVTGTFFSGLSETFVDYTEGQDSEVYVNGSADPLIRSSNSVVVNGIKYYLKEASETVHTITTSADSDSTVEAITDFFEKYNELVDTINTKLTEKYDSDYLPLTDEQKAEMSETQIESWEEKAKTGLLRNDRLLENLLLDLRTAISDSISDVTGSIFDLGISTGSYSDKGKITIDETQLKYAIDENPDKVMNIFAKESTTYPTYYRSYDSDEISTRYDEEGIMYRLSDIIELNISVTRDSSDQKGFLIEKAGVVNDTSEINNTLYDELYDYNTRIADMEDRLLEKEDSYYRKFTAMESAISRMNSQSMMITSMFSNG